MYVCMCVCMYVCILTSQTMINDYSCTKLTSNSYYNFGTTYGISKHIFGCVSYVEITEEADIIKKEVPVPNLYTTLPIL